MSISEVSKLYGLSPDTLRYYERIGLLPPVKRTAGGCRDYDQVSCNWIQFIKCMRGSGVSVEALVEYVALFQQGDDTIGARKELLIEQRDLLEQRVRELQETLARLEQKVLSYEKLISYGDQLRES